MRRNSSQPVQMTNLSSSLISRRHLLKGGLMLGGALTTMQIFPNHDVQAASRTVNRNSSFLGWVDNVSLGGSVTGQPSAVSWGPGRLDKFSVG